MFHVTFSLLRSEVVTEAHHAIAAKYGAESRLLESGSTSFSFLTEKFTLADADVIVDSFDHIHIWGKGRTQSARYKGRQWECTMPGWNMVPGFDNSPTYNVESVELCPL